MYSTDTMFAIAMLSASTCAMSFLPYYQSRKEIKHRQKVIFNCKSNLDYNAFQKDDDKGTVALFKASKISSRKAQPETSPLST